MNKVKILTIGIAVFAGFFLSRAIFAEVENPAAESVKHDENEHEHHAPHNGTLVVFGDEFAHLEMVLDSESGRLTAYSLDGEAEYAVRLKQESVEIAIVLDGNNIVLTLNAVDNPLTGETIGDTSEFTAQSDMLKGVKSFKGNVIMINTKGAEFKDVEFSFPEGNE